MLPGTGSIFVSCVEKYGIDGMCWEAGARGAFETSSFTFLWILELHLSKYFVSDEQELILLQTGGLCRVSWACAVLSLAM